MSWDFLINDCLRKIAQTSPFAKSILKIYDKCMHQGGDRPLPQTFPSSSGSRHACSRARARHNRGRLSRFLTNAFGGVCAWLRAGGIGDSIPESESASEWACMHMRGCASKSSQASPFDFSADKRGRCLNLLESVMDNEEVSCVKFDFCPLSWAYESCGPSKPEGFVASRLALPEQAATFPLDCWLSQSSSEAWNNPDLPSPIVRPTFLVDIFV